MIKVCFVLISDGWGGAEHVVYRLLKEMEKEDYDVYLILNQEIMDYFRSLERTKIINIGCCYDIRAILKNLSYLGNKKERLNLKCVRKEYIPGSEVFLNLIRIVHIFRQAKAISKYLRIEGVQIVHSHLEKSDIFALFLKKTLDSKTKFITTIHGKHMPHLYKHVFSTIAMRPLEMLLLRFSLENFDAVTSVSRWQLNQIEKVADITQNKHVIANGIDLKEIREISTHEIDNKGRFEILFPGGDKTWKGTDLILQAISIIRNFIPNVHLYITGNVSKDGVTNNLVKSLNLEEIVTIYGFLKQEDHYKLLNAIDVLCLPSREEAFGIVFLEAMALGKPIVSTKLCGIPEILTNEVNAILVEPTAEDVANGILRLYNEPVIRESIVRTNLEYVKQFDITKVVDKYVQIYQEIIDFDKSEFRTS